MTSNPRRPEIALIVATKRGHCQWFEQCIAELKCLGQTRPQLNTRRDKASNRYRDGLTLGPTKG